LWRKCSQNQNIGPHVDEYFCGENAHKIKTLAPMPMNIFVAKMLTKSEHWPHVDEHFSGQKKNSYESNGTVVKGIFLHCKK
jgi:hypothetical protein